MKKQPTPKAREVYDKLMSIHSAGESVYWTKAELYLKLKTDKLYRLVFGVNDQSWASFCAEIGVPVSSADQKIKNYEFFVNVRGLTREELSGADTSCLYYITRYKPEATRAEVLDWINVIKTVSRGDFIQMIKGNDECMHDRTEEVVKKKCASCGRTLSLNTVGQ